MKCEQHWPRGCRGGHLKLSTFFSIQMNGAHTCIRNKFDPVLKGQTSMYNYILATLVDLPSPMINAKIQPQYIFCSGDF